jgi:hypothetical protein
MPFAYVHRVEDEAALSSVREHVADATSAYILETYEPMYESFDGESLHVVSWPVCGRTEGDDGE